MLKTDETPTSTRPNRVRHLLCRAEILICCWLGPVAKTPNRTRTLLPRRRGAIARPLAMSAVRSQTGGNPTWRGQPNSVAFHHCATWAMSVYALIDILERKANECRSRRIPRAYKMERVTDKRRSSGIHAKTSIKEGRTCRSICMRQPTPQNRGPRR